jgi:hypothetical protein
MHTHTGGVNMRCPGFWEAAQRLLNNVQLCAEATPYRLGGYHEAVSWRTWKRHGGARGIP